MPAYEHFSSTEVLSRLAMEKMLAKLSTRRYRSGLEPVGKRVEASARSTSQLRGLAALRRGHRARSRRAAGR